LPEVDPEHVLRHLKSLPDSERRAAVQDAATVAPLGLAADPTASESALDVWQRAGYELGNHTWDHPCLDHCDPSEQTRQIVLADEWLAARGAFDSVRLFAFPNGDWTAESERTLVDLGYSTALLFDHQTVDTRSVQSIRLSRLRLDADAPLHRARAVLSGGHSWLYARS
jgi:peptidoglycan/xylan/chitin deacetylase (PgdA/CDA1 family)